MKNLKLFASFLVMVGAVLVSCNKNVDIPATTPETGEEIVLNVDGAFDAVVDTKGTDITALPTTLYWGATTGGNAAGSTEETVKWATASGTVSSGKISTGKYQTSTATAYNYYVANQTFTAGGAMTVANNTTDIVVGRTFGSNASQPAVTVSHIFASMGTLTMNTQSGYTISNVSWKIASSGSNTGTKGTYNVRTKAWSSTTAYPETAIASGSNLYLIPGTYTVKCTYTLTRGDWTGTFTKSASVTIVAGKKNNITGTATGGTASQIQINVTLEAWGSQNHTPTFS